MLLGTGLFPAFKVEENPIFSIKFKTCFAKNEKINKKIKFLKKNK